MPEPQPAREGRREANAARAARSGVAQAMALQAAVAGLQGLEPGRVAALAGGGTDEQAARLSDERLLEAQRQAIALQIGQVQGNHHLQRVLVQRTPDDGEEEGEEQPDVEEHSSERALEMRAERAARGAETSPEEGSQPPVTEVEVTPEEAWEDIYGRGVMPSTEEIEASMSAIGMTEATETMLFINMPGLIGGMPYERDRMQALFSTLRDARERITHEPAYAQWLENPADPARRAALDLVIAQFERDTGTGIREGIRSYWEGRRAGDPAGATTLAGTCAEVEQALLTESERLFPGGAEPPEALEIADAEDLQARLTALHGRLGTELIPAANRISLGGLDREHRAQAVSALGTLRSAISRTQRIVRPRLGRVAVTTLFTRFAEAVQAAGAAAAALRQLAQRMEEHNSRVDVMVTAIMDPAQVPILVPTTRRTAAVTFRGERTTYHTHHESRMSYYAEAFMLTGTRPARSLDGVPTQAERPADPRLRRSADVYADLVAQGVAVSEAKMLAAISYSEGGFGSPQTVDLVRVSYGILSFQGHALMRVLRRLRDDYPGVFSEYFESYGITIAERGRTPTPVERESRSAAGRAEGFQTHEAYGVEQLLVYDHRTREWVSGNEGLAVIQGDPRYQALFVAAGSTSAMQTVQMMEARSSFVHTVRNERLTLGSGEGRRALQVKDFVNSEVAMFGLVDRKVASGNIGFATAMFNGYLEARSIAAADLPARSQSDIAAWVRGYGAGIRWELADQLEAAGIAALRDDAYEGAV